MSEKCSAADELAVDFTVFVFLVVYVAILSCVQTYYALKFVVYFLRKRSAKAKVYRQRTLAVLKPVVGTQQISGATPNESQGLAIKRLLFHNMNRGTTDEDGYVEMRANTSSSKRDRGRKQWETDFRRIKFQTKIGAGNFGEVWVGQWMGSTVAVKTVLKRMANNKEFVAKFMEEIQLMSELNHPNIVMFLGASIQPPHICLILEYCVHGNLIEFLQSAKGQDINISMHLILKMALDIARGIKYLHEKIHLIQRDIKGRNVLVDENLNAKIADFGLSRLKKGEDDAGLTACGTPAWTAPEVVRMEDYTEKVDVYSFGMVLWELFMREEPYSGEGGIQIAYAAAEQGLRPPVPSHAPPRYSYLMQQCWADSPHERPNFTDILERLFQMMKDESNPFKAAEFYFGSRKHTYDDDLQELLDEADLTDGLFAEDYVRILNERKAKSKETEDHSKRHARAPSGSETTKLHIMGPGSGNGGGDLLRNLSLAEGPQEEPSSPLNPPAAVIEEVAPQLSAVLAPLDPQPSTEAEPELGRDNAT